VPLQARWSNGYFEDDALDEIDPVRALMAKSESRPEGAPEHRHGINESQPSLGFQTMPNRANS
jgi:hypothetical protein